MARKNVRKPHAANTPPLPPKRTVTSPLPEPAMSSPPPIHRHTVKAPYTFGDCDTFEVLSLKKHEFTPMGGVESVGGLHILDCLCKPQTRRGVLLSGVASPICCTTAVQELDEDDQTGRIVDGWGPPVETNPMWVVYIRAFPLGSLSLLYNKQQMPPLVLLKHACIHPQRQLAYISILMTTEETTFQSDDAFNATRIALGERVAYHPFIPLTLTLGVNGHQPATAPTFASLLNIAAQPTRELPPLGYHRHYPTPDTLTIGNGVPLCPSEGVHNIVGNLFGYNNLVRHVTQEARARLHMNDDVPMVMATAVLHATTTLHNGDAMRTAKSMHIGLAMMRAIDLTTVCALWASTATRIALPSYMNEPFGAPLVLALALRLACNVDVLVHGNPSFVQRIGDASAASHAAVQRVNRLFCMQFAPLDATVFSAIDAMFTTVMVNVPLDLEVQVWENAAQLVLMGRDVALHLFGSTQSPHGVPCKDALGLDALCTQTQAAEAALRMLATVERFCRYGTWPTKGAASALGTTNTEPGDRDGPLARQVLEFTNCAPLPFVYTHRHNATKDELHKLIFESTFPLLAPSLELDSVHEQALHPNAAQCSAVIRSLLYWGLESQVTNMNAFVISPDQVAMCANESCGRGLTALTTVPFNRPGRACSTCSRFFCNGCMQIMNNVTKSCDHSYVDCTSCADAKRALWSTITAVK